MAPLYGAPLPGSQAAGRALSRTGALGLRAPRADLALYLAIEAPQDRFLGGWARVGVVSENGDGLALLGGGKKTLTRIESHGEGDAERLLLGLVEGWERRGRPTGHDLEVEVDFERGADSGVRLSWAS